MASHKIKCFDNKCEGTPFAIDDGAARLAVLFGRVHYQCDKCRARWSVDVFWYLQNLAPIVHHSTRSR